MNKSSAPAIVWFRHDLRLADNPALSAAAARGPVVPLFIWAPEEAAPWAPGAASRWWLHQSLAALDSQLSTQGSSLVLRQGSSFELLRKVAAESGATAVYWNRQYEPAVRQRDDKIAQALESIGIRAESHNGSLLHEPSVVKNKNGRPFQVFTAFWRHCLGVMEPGEPLSAPSQLRPPGRWPSSLLLGSLKLEPVKDWAAGLRSAWEPGEIAARRQLDTFIEHDFKTYGESRNFPAVAGTSRLSPHLHFGEISPRQVWNCVQGHAERCPRHGEKNWRGSQFITELGWREFAHYLLYHFPHTSEEPLKPEFARFRWRGRPEWLRAWQRGSTGYPLVDAGMRELWQTGWMHNRVRMVVASFLVKDLLISWTQGARWFWDTLVDADLAQNTLGWQWTAGSGADAAPFFRIFNPAGQAEKFDPAGEYVRRWLPELASIPDKWIHTPHLAPPEVLKRAGVEPGKTYPLPVVSHLVAREVALEEYNRVRKGH